MSWASYADAVKRYFKFSKDELKALVITIVVLTFIMAFNDKRPEFSVVYWTSNFLLWLAIVAVSVMIHHAGHRLIAIKIGFKVEFRLWWYGLGAGLIMALITRGTIPLLLPGGIYVHHLAAHRLGAFRYGPNVVAISIIAMMGPLFNIFLATIVKTLQIWVPFGLLNTAIVDRIFIFNLLFAMFTLLPIPPLDGSRMFFHSRLAYAFVFGTVATYVLLAYVFQFYSYITALVVGGAIWLVYFVVFERTAVKF